MLPPFTHISARRGSQAGCEPLSARQGHAVEAHPQIEALAPLNRQQRDAAAAAARHGVELGVARCVAHLRPPPPAHSRPLPMLDSWLSVLQPGRVQTGVESVPGGTGSGCQLSRHRGFRRAAGRYPCTD